MKLYHSKKISLLLVVVLFFNIITFGLFGSQKVEAGFWDEHQGSILTVIKGLVMLWIINLMRQNATDNGNDDLLTSTIKKGLNLDNGEVNKVEEREVIIEDTVEVMEEPTVITADEQEMLDLVNEVRLEKGLVPLEVDLELVKVARMKAQDMVENDYLEHYSPTYGSPFDMIKNAGIVYSLAGENLVSAGNIKEALNALVESTPHRDNILNSRFDKVGLGVIKDGISGLKIVQLFIDSPDPTE